MLTGDEVVPTCLPVQVPFFWFCPKSPFRRCETYAYLAHRNAASRARLAAPPESGSAGERDWSTPMDPQRNAFACPFFWGDARRRITRVSHRARELGWELTVLHRVRLPSVGLLGHGGARHQ